MRTKTPKKDMDRIFREHVLIDEALQKAFREAIERHRRAGVPMVFWEDGRIVEIPAEEVAARLNKK